MLKNILSVTGKPGLYKLLSGNKKMIIAESLIDGKKSPVHSHEKVISLADIAIYTDTKEVPLREVFATLLEKSEGKESLDSKVSSTDELKKHFATVLPDYDRDRVHNSDIKKIYAWYNLLIKNNITDFSEEKENEEVVSE
ncbi:MAG: DUF5606 domain-containing protein [Paludibacteraceae bacterium]|jgi:hypothetical protein|nr:DUF5606 domain-containing protein [Paludibacteraceae bacterium]MBP8781515.1 DUF5606 domain-containing protein [Paludibacteraceae bacterium]MBP9648736.1 DUF5606 domain-containing protein [Paludibacteraceae bacterium]HOR40652.1 DUF5606 domain-containing protein [Paludibacteraceae bacterium]HOU27321.1 DUF5606 domain-containing protein [Paludibacteraceae bacterium]